MTLKKKVSVSLGILIICSFVVIIPTRENIPCLLFHHVAPNNRVSPAEFEQLLVSLREEGYNSLHFSELPKESSPKNLSKSIILTFDDGFLDNYINAFPLLKKYDYKATVFIIASKSLTQKLPGYLTPPQMLEMKRSGLIDIQSHSYTHSYCYISDKIIAFNSPSFYDIVYSPDEDRRLGIPIYERHSSLVSPCYRDDISVRNTLASYVAEHGGQAFFADNTHSVDVLIGLAQNCKKTGNSTARRESPAEYENRVSHELDLSRKLIEFSVQPCTVIAWPWGQYNAGLLSLAQRSGYNISVTADRGTNYYGDINPLQIKRIEADEYGIEKMFLGRLSLPNSIKIRLFIYDHYLIGHLYDTASMIVKLFK